MIIHHCHVTTASKKSKYLSIYIEVHSIIVNVPMNHPHIPKNFCKSTYIDIDITNDLTNDKEKKTELSS